MYIKDYQPLKYDLDYARQLVKESGYDGTEIELEIKPGYYLNGDQAAEAVVAMWKEIGVNAKVVFNEKMTWDFKHVRPWSSASRYDDPLGALWLLFGPGSQPSKNSWLDMPDDWKETGKLLTTTTDPKQRQELARKLLEMFDKYAPGTYLYIAEELYGIRDGFDWDMYYARNQIMPFRAGDFKAVSK
jgi:peptide/nickel transport system substrate-binding protein